jgi:hypothetical protein
MAILPLLDDGSCGQQNTCLTRAGDVHATCPQAMKCGTCVAWTPREKNRFTRNAGQCLLDRNATQYLDCNAAICPYYRPRAENPAAEAWKSQVPAQRQREVRTRVKGMTREAPPPTAEALAHASFAEHPTGVAAVGVPVLSAILGEGLAPLLERFRGGTVKVGDRSMPIEALWARILQVRRTLGALDRSIDSSGLDAETRSKIEKDIAGMAGSMTTFNVLFARKDDGFKGTGKGE